MAGSGSGAAAGERSRRRRVERPPRLRLNPPRILGLPRGRLPSRSGRSRRAAGLASSRSGGKENGLCRRATEQKGQIEEEGDRAEVDAVLLVVALAVAGSGHRWGWPWLARAVAGRVRETSLGGGGMRPRA
jgi:hypothetical protein